MIYPVQKVHISQFFGDNPDYYIKYFGLPYHDGIDFVDLYGSPILSSIDGEVIQTWWRGEQSDLGNGVLIGNESFEVLNWHMSSVKCAVGQSVKVGEVIGAMGNSGFVWGGRDPKNKQKGTHLHFAVKPLKDGKEMYPNETNGYVDPLPYINMLKLIGDESTKKQYILGADNKLRWIFNTTLLDDLHCAGVIDKNNIIWKTKLENEIVDPWAVIK